MIQQQSLLHSNKRISVQEQNIEPNQQQLHCNKQHMQQQDNILDVTGKTTGKNQ